MGLDLAGLDYELNWVPIQDLKSEEFLKINPNGKVPTLETEDGPIFETHAILRYAARRGGKGYGATPYENAQVDQWLDWVNCELQPLAPQFLYQIFGFEFPGLSYEKDGMFKAKAEFLKRISHLNTSLNGKDFIVGSEMTIADVALINSTVQFLTFCVADKQRKGFANVYKWLENCAQNAAFQKWFGRLRLIPKPLNFAKVETAPQAAPAKKSKSKSKSKSKAREAAPAPAPSKPKGPQFPPSKIFLT